MFSYQCAGSQRRLHGRLPGKSPQVRLARDGRRRFLKIGILQSAASVGAFLGPVTGGLLYGFSRLGSTNRGAVQFWMWLRFSGRRFLTRLHQRLPEQLACLRWLLVRHKSHRCTQGGMLGMLAGCPAVVVAGLTSVHHLTPAKTYKQLVVLLDVATCASSGCVLGPKIDMAHHRAPPSDAQDLLCGIAVHLFVQTHESNLA